MTNLSSRSKDNATDLISLKEATKRRDEDIRQSLRDLVHSLYSLESDRLLTDSSLPLLTSGLLLRVVELRAMRMITSQPQPELGARNPVWKWQLLSGF